MAQTNETIKSIILTLKNRLVVVPNAAVAEIIAVEDLEQKENLPNWVLGKTRWRGVDLPVVCYEAAGGDDAQTVTLNTQVAIMYSASAEADRTYPYIGLVMHGVPHVSTFSRDQIRTDEHDTDNHPMVAQKVRINGAAAGILDIRAIERMLQQAAV